MSLWSQLGLQESFSTTIELLNYFHDHMMMILSVIIVFVTVVFLSVLVENGSDHYLLDSHSLEFIWTVVPMGFLLFMALPSLYLLYLTEDVLQPAVVVNVVAHQWFWEYEYYSSYNFNSYMLPSDSSNVRLLDVDNRLVLPNFSSSMLMITSADVLHSWAMPSMGVNVDAIPGRLNYAHVTPSSYGVFYGQCSELCGSNHSFMPIVLEVTTPSALSSYLSNL